MKRFFGSITVLAVLLTAVIVFNITFVQADGTCIGSGNINFVSWDLFGAVRMQYTNTSSVPMRLTDFNIIWDNIVTRAGLMPGVLTLGKVIVGGSGLGDPLGVTVWDAPSGQDALSPTNGRGESTWLTDYIFPPNSTTNIHIDFDGTSNNLQSAFGAQLSDFNGTVFTITPDCVGGSSIPISDGRVNPGWGDHFAVIYTNDGAGNPALRIYRIGDHSEGWLALALDLEDIPTEVEANTLIASENGIAVYALNTGEIQIVLGPDETGKFYTIILNGLPYTSHYYLP